MGSASGPLLPTHYQYQKAAPTRVLRNTEKYVLVVAVVAFCLVFLGAVYLPREDLPQFRKLVNPEVIDPHGHFDQNDHRDSNKDSFRDKVRSPDDLQDYVLTLEDKLKLNQDKIESLKSELNRLQRSSSGKTIRRENAGDVQENVEEDAEKDVEEDPGNSNTNLCHTF